MRSSVSLDKKKLSLNGKTAPRKLRNVEVAECACFTITTGNTTSDYHTVGQCEIASHMGTHCAKYSVAKNVGYSASVRDEVIRQALAAHGVVGIKKTHKPSVQEAAELLADLYKQ